MANGETRQPRQAAGTAGMLRVLGRGLRGPSGDLSDADIKALDQGRVIWMTCFLRATYGDYPRGFRQRKLHLTPDGMVLRPLWFSVPRKTFRIRENILDGHARPYNLKTDWNLKAKGRYAEGGPYSFAGFVVIACRTESGTIELAVPRPDVPLLMHYIHREKPRSVG